MMRKLLLLILLFFFVITWCNNSDSENVKECKKMVLEWLKFPSTAVFYNVHDIQSDIITWMFVKWRVESQNWYWTMVVTNFYCAPSYWPEWDYRVFVELWWEYIYEFLQEVENTWKRFDFWEFRLKKIFENDKDKISSCSTLVKKALWVLFVNWLEERSLEWISDEKLESIWLQRSDAPVDFYIIDSNTFEKKEWYCMFNNSFSNIWHGILWLYYDWEEIWINSL